MTAGKVTVTVNGYPFISIRSDVRELDVDVSGAKRAGLSLGGALKLGEGGSGVLAVTERMAKELSRMDWKLTLFYTGTQILTMGRGVSRLTAHVRVNPLGLRRLLDALR